MIQVAVFLESVCTSILCWNDELLTRSFCKLQERLIKSMVNGAAPVDQVVTTSNADVGSLKDSTSQRPIEKLKPLAVKDGRKDLEEVRVSKANGELRDDPTAGLEKPVSHIEDEAGTKSRDKERERPKLRESRDSGRDWDVDRETERSRARARERDRERLREKEWEREEREIAKEREYRRKERGRDLGEHLKDVVLSYV